MAAEHPNENRLWLSGRPGLEAWSSNWKSASTTAHAHDFYQLTVATAGQGSIRTNKASRPLGPCDGVLIPPGCVHTLCPTGTSWQFETLYFAPSDFAQVFGSQSPPCELSPLPLWGARPAVRARFQHAMRAIRTGQALLEQSAQLFDFLLELRPLISSSAEGEPVVCSRRLQDVREFLERETERNVSLEELSQIAGLEACYLSRAFRRAFGLPPHAYHLQNRIHRARSLVKLGVPLAEVALRTGFTDQAHLTRHFRQLVGVTPGILQEQVKIIQER